MDLNTLSEGSFDVWGENCTSLSLPQRSILLWCLQMCHGNTFKSLIRVVHVIDVDRRQFELVSIHWQSQSTQLLWAKHCFVDTNGWNYIWSMVGSLCFQIIVYVWHVNLTQYCSSQWWISVTIVTPWFYLLRSSVKTACPIPGSWVRRHMSPVSVSAHFCLLHASRATAQADKMQFSCCQCWS
jgi:hypothetical protein